MIESYVHSVHTHNPEPHLGPTVNMFLHNFSGLQRHYVWLHQLQRHRNDGEDVRRCEQRHCQLGGRGGGHGDGDGRGVPAVKEREVTTTKDPTITRETGRENRDSLIEKEGERRVRSHDNIQSQDYHDKLGSSPHKSREKTVRTSWLYMKK